MTNFFKLTVLIFLLFSCSLNDVGGFWSKEKDLKKEELKFEILFKKDKKISREFNKNFQLILEKKDFKINNLSNINNDDGYVLFNGMFEKIQKYNFSKIKNFDKFDPNLIFYNGSLIFFDNSGSILNFDENSKLLWKINNYSKSEKKNGPLISMTKFNNNLLVSDNLSKIYSIDINTGKVLWSKKNNSPFNSEIKTFKNKIFVVDSNNTLNCFSAIDGRLIWKHSTEKSFINSSKKLSILVKDNIVVFSNSLGDLTAVNINNGSLLWQRFTQNSRIYEEIMTLKISSLIENDNSIYFSNNKNQFYSLDLNTGTTNWIQDINSNIKPSIINNLIFTISLDGYYFVIEKKSGNIIRISNIFHKLEQDKNKTIYPTGFVFNFNELFVSTNIGKLIVVDIKSGLTKNFLKIDKQKISRPFVQNENMYLIEDNSIIRLN